jgi:hypothetical protein
MPTASRIAKHAFFLAKGRTAEQRTPYFSIRNAGGKSNRLEPELNASLVTEVTLVLISLGESVAEAREHVINLRGPDGD